MDFWELFLFEFFSKLFNMSLDYFNSISFSSMAFTLLSMIPLLPIYFQNLKSNFDLEYYDEGHLVEFDFGAS